MVEIMVRINEGQNNSSANDSQDKSFSLIKTVSILSLIFVPISLDI